MSAIAQPSAELPRVPNPVQITALLLAMTAIVLLAASVLMISLKQLLLFGIGVGLGISLYHAAFGFTGAYRRAMLEGDISGVTAQLIMLAVAVLLFAPILAQGEAFGRGVGGAVAPVSLSMALGAFLFGIGMQLGGSCASGTLFAAGGGSLRTLLVLVFFCIGAFWGSLDLAWWSQLPGVGSVSLSEHLGWEIALPLQLGALALIYAVMRFFGGTQKRPLWDIGHFRWQTLLRGPWPLLLSALLLALFNWLTLLVAGHPWSITWAFSLWAAKAAVFAGWDPATSGFWSGGFQQAALERSVLQDVTSVMNFGIILGAFLAAALAGRLVKPAGIAFRSLTAAVLGGLIMGYGARLSYGCNIGAFFSGVASTSLHGWVWIACALPGNYIGVRLRPFFRL
ncbi:YeeE/YedE family protein [Denitrobaculum tricleocarpae]|uniref:YeeE/YedE family protein n=1 Tax=Denitrobaculum tricleocarpae TaxID=2591009 RepID=A0A545TM79_9PROT|nr:YeeE/YedE family protein [Denitrobaculum tricleocarpae]TQV78332.1 YeeE/YedE family protein [Denitrobaculum tricleocarpae]